MISLKDYITEAEIKPYRFVYLWFDDPDDPDDPTYDVIYYPAVWDEGKGIPRLNTKGLYITIGMRFFDY